MKEIVIYDANIFIDVIDMEIIKALREADYRIYTTSLVTNEIIRTEQKAALSGLQISIYRYDSIEQYTDLYAFKDSVHPKKNLSDSDFSVLKLALDMSVPLYTSDAKLWSVARINGVEVHGSLGLVIELNKAGLLSCEEAKEAIFRLQKANTRIAEKVYEEALDALK